MTIRYSDALRNHIAATGSLAAALAGGFMRIYSGNQPASAQQSVSATPLLDLTSNGSGFVAGVQGSGSITLNSVTSGATITGITVGTVTFTFPSAIVVGASDTVTTVAAALAKMINEHCTDRRYFAVASAGVVTLYENRRFLSTCSGLTIVLATTGTITDTITNFGTSSASQNGISWVADGNTGEISKNPAETWQGTASAGGQAGWFRIFGALGAADTVFVDGSIGTAGTDLIMLPSVTITQNAISALNAATIQQP